MALRRLMVRVGAVRWGPDEGVRDGVLTVDRDALAAALGGDGALDVAGLDVAQPGEPVRLVNIDDVFLPQVKLEPRGADFPGLLGPARPAGQGATLVLDGVAVTVISGVGSRYNKVLDLCGRGAALSPYGGLAHVVVRTRPRPGAPAAAYGRAMKACGARAAVEVARRATGARPAAEEIIDLERPAAPGLPRVGYVFMLTSLQRPPEADEPILYGTSVGGIKPLLLHPAEVLDGAVCCPHWTLGMETYAIQDHAVVRELCRRHGRDVHLAGVIATVAQVDPLERAVAVEMTAHLARWALRAEGLVFSKAGGGIPESDMVLTMEACERVGIATSAVLWSHLGTGPDDSLVLPSPLARALASAGLQDEGVRLPAVDGLVGALDDATGDGSDEGGFGPDAAGALTVLCRDIAGAISQVGHSRLGMRVTPLERLRGPAGSA